MILPTQTTDSHDVVGLVEDDLRDLEVHSDDLNLDARVSTERGLGEEQAKARDRLEKLLRSHRSRIFLMGLLGLQIGGLAAAIGIWALGGFGATLEPATAIVVSVGAAAAVLLVLLITLSFSRAIRRSFQIRI